ncbi:MAG: 30S ribosomal protein S6 [Myxococcota bacterium]
MREYETTFIVQPEISEEGSTAILEKLDSVLEKSGDTRLCVEDHGKRKLAYEIRKFHKGHYYTLSFLGDGQSVPEIERTLRLEESVLRFLTIQAEEKVADVEARKAAAAEFEADQARRAAEKAAREAEEAAAREEAERTAAAEAAAAASAAEAAAEKAEKAGEAGSEEPAAAEAGESTPEAATAAETPAASDAAGDAEEGAKS